MDVMRPAAWRSGLLMTLMVIAGCQDGVAPPLGLLPADTEPFPSLPPPNPYVLSGSLALRGASALSGDEEGPPWVGFRVNARNVGSVPLSAEDLCFVQVRATVESSPSSSIAWRHPLEPAADCSVPIAGDSEIPPSGLWTVPAAGLWELVSMHDVLGDSLPEGRYRFELLVRFDGDTVSVPSGALPLTRDTRRPLSDPLRLRYAVRTNVESVSPRELVMRVIVTNPTNRYVLIHYGACHLRIRAFRTPERIGNPVWRSEDLQHGCALYLAQRLIAPGESASPSEFNARIPVHRVLGDALPDGQYYFTAELGAVRFRAGSAVLSSVTDPLPTERVVGGVRYHAETTQNADNADTFHVSLSSANEGDEDVIVLGRAGVTCPSFLYGYASRSARDRWYLGSSVAWSADECPLRLPSTWLAPGDTVTFVSALPAIADGRGPGRYHLSLFFWPANLEWPDGPSLIGLSAGTVTLNGG